MSQATVQDTRMIAVVHKFLLKIPLFSSSSIGFSSVNVASVPLKYCPSYVLLWCQQGPQGAKLQPFQAAPGEDKIVQSGKSWHFYSLLSLPSPLPAESIRQLNFHPHPWQRGKPRKSINYKNSLNMKFPRLFIRFFFITKKNSFHKLFLLELLFDLSISL